LLQLKAKAEEELRKRYGSSFSSFISRVEPRYPLGYIHTRKIVDVLDRVERGELKRVMFFMPPRYWKSGTASRLFPAYYLYKHPENYVILTSYAAELAFSLSRDARYNYLKTGRVLDDDASSQHEWMTSQRGSFLASGVGGPLTGHGFHLGIIDDPIKNAEEAYSEQVRDAQWQWYKTTFYTRMEKNAAIILILTRWHEDDIAGRLLQEEKTSPEGWHIVSLEALKEDTPAQFPPTCTIELDWRSPGEALCEDIHTREALIHIRSKSETVFSALYQQRPTLEGGSVWKRDWFKTIEDHQLDEMVIMDVGTDWDLAYTKDESNSANAYVKAGVGIDGNIYVLDLDFKWMEFPDLIEWMMQIGEPYYIEKKATGKSAAQMLVKVGLYATEVPVRGGDKIARSRIASPIVEQGKVFVKASLMRKLLDDPQQGLLRFPAASHNDLNDAFTQMLNRLWSFKKPEEELEPVYASAHEKFIAEVMNKIGGTPKVNYQK